MSGLPAVPGELLHIANLVRLKCMHHMLIVAAGVLAAVLNVSGTVPYVRDIFRRRTKPERAMWWIYAVLFGVLFFAQVDAGAGWLLLITATYVLAAILIAVLSVWYGYGRLHKRDVISFGIAALGLVLWALTSDPLLAILMVIVVDFAGFWLTIVKTWHAPHSETLLAWQLSFVAAIVSIFSIDTWKLSVLIYPVYSVLGIALLIAIIIARRRVVKEDPADFGAN